FAMKSPARGAAGAAGSARRAGSGGADAARAARGRVGAWVASGRTRPTPLVARSTGRAPPGAAARGAPPGPARLRPGVPLAAVGARPQVLLHAGSLGGRGLAVDPGREELTRVLAAHEKNRSSLSFRSIRARCSRERTVPGSSSSARAISA